MTAFRRTRPSRPRTLLPALGLASALVVLGSACEVRTTVGVVAREDGSGTVEVAVGLDAEALAEVPDLDGDGRSGVADLTALVRTEDLEAAGWRVSEPTEAGADLTWVRVAKPFGTPDEANAILAEVSGSDGPLRDLRLERTTGFADTDLTFTGTADLSGGLEAFGDSGLAGALDGEPLGEDVAEIEQRIGEPVADTFRLDVTVDLPGGLDANTDDRDGGAARWSPRLGEEAQSLEATGSVRDAPVLLLTAIAALSGIALVAVAALRLLPRPAPAPHPRPDADESDAETADAESAADAGDDRPTVPAARPSSGDRWPAVSATGADTESSGDRQLTGSSGSTGSTGPPIGGDGGEDVGGAGSTDPEPGDSEHEVPGWRHPPPVPPADAGDPAPGPGDPKPRH